MTRKRPAILLGPNNAAAFQRQLTRVVAGAGCCPNFAIIFSVADERGRERLQAELLYDEGQPLFVRAHKPRPPAWCPHRGGRRNQHLPYDEEVAFLKEMESLADAGHRIGIADLQAALASRTGSSVSGSVILQILGRHGWVRLGLLPIWERRRNSAMRRLGHLRRLERDGVRTQKPSAASTTDTPGPGEVDGGVPAPGPVPSPHPSAAAPRDLLQVEGAL